jgi:hypothetical protein
MKKLITSVGLSLILVCGVSQFMIVNAVATCKPRLAPQTIVIHKRQIRYNNGGTKCGQSIIDKHKRSLASTWGGTQTFSGTDQKNTHFIGHSPGAFQPMLKLKKGEKIRVTDKKGRCFTYVVKSRVVVDKYAFTKTGKDYYMQIVETGKRERITLQTCLNKKERLIVFADKQ